MKRTRTKKNKRGPANAILVSDLHLTESTPVSRTDDYLEAQRKKLKFLLRLSQENNNCPILCGGDVFDYWKASPHLCSMAFWLFAYLGGPLVTVPGQHDLPLHSMKNYGRSALALLESVTSSVLVFSGGKTGNFMNYGIQVTGVGFGQLDDFTPEQSGKSSNYRKVLILHELTWSKQRPPWSKGSWTDKELLDKFGQHFDLIVTGDNHSAFVTEGRNSLLVNPGSMLRKNADQADYSPRCYLYYAKENEVKAVHFPIEKEVHDREHIDRSKERDERVAAYIERMREDWEIGVSFERNLQAFFDENKTPRKVRELIWQHLEPEKT